MRRRGTHISSLDKVACDKQVLLVGRDLDVVRSDDGLVLFRVVEALDVVKIRNIEGGHVISKRDGEVGELAVIRDVRIDGDRFLGFRAEVVKELCDALATVGPGTEGVDDPH